MSTRQVDFKDKNGNKLVGNTTTTAVADVAKNVPLSETLTKVVEKEALGYLPFSVASTYAVGNIVFYVNKLYKFTSAKSAGAWDPTKVEEYSIKDSVDEVADALQNEIEAREESEEQFAKKDGYYAQMGVGSADNLVGRGDGVPAEFTYRTTGGSADVADGVASIQEIHGNSLVFNQLVKIPDESKTITESGVTITDNRDGSYTINGTATADVTLDLHPQNAEGNVSGHKYLEMGIAGGHADTYLFGNGFSSTTGNSAVTDPVIFTAGDALINIRLYVMEGAELSNVVVRPQLIDLTKMFGSGNEPNSVADFKALYPLDYYAHNEGEIVSFNGNKIKAVGFNQWDEEWEVGSINDDNGQNEPTTVAGRSKNYIEIIPNANYCLHYPTSITSSSMRVFFYNSQKEYISKTIWKYANDVISTPTNAMYMRFKMANTYGPTYNHDICINLSWSGIRNGEYEPYTTNERELPIGKINTDGTITESAEGKTRLFPNGLLSAGTAHDVVTNTKAIKGVGVVDLGLCTYSYTLQQVNPHAFTIKLPSGYYTAKLFNAYTLPHFTISDGTELFTQSAFQTRTTRGISGNNNPNTTAIIVLPDVDNPEDAKNSLNGVYLCYDLAEPIEVTFPEPINLSYQVSDFGTEEILPENDDEPTTSPFKGVIKYGMNAEGTIRNLPKNFISKESMENFLTALSTEMGGTWEMTYNEDSGEFDFEFTETPTE